MRWFMFVVNVHFSLLLLFYENIISRSVIKLLFELQINFDIFSFFSFNFMYEITILGRFVARSLGKEFKWYWLLLIQINNDFKSI